MEMIPNWKSLFMGVAAGGRVPLPTATDWIFIHPLGFSYLIPRASAEKLSGDQRKRRPKNSKKITKNSTIKSFPGGEGRGRPTKKRPKNNKKTEK